jgi:2-polyprenyl-6-methoxyphenol hydroxylase-like FAD-dependent oxidoreductase
MTQDDSHSMMAIGIAGAGFAGLTAGALLARQGHRVTIFERARVLGPVGAAIVIQPSGLAVLGHLGRAAEVVDAGARIDRLHVTAPSGRTILDLRYATLDDSWFGLGIARGALFTALLAAATDAGAVVRPGTPIAGAEADADGRWLIDAAGERHGPFGLIIAADGARSTLAAALPSRRVKPYRWGALFHVGPASAGDTLIQVADGARRFMGILPMGGGQASLFWSLRGDRVDAWRAGFDAWRSEAVAMHPAAEALVETIDRPEDVLFAPYFDVTTKRPFAIDPSGSALVVIGDAAHATSPQLGQGTNLALLDAWHLAEAIADARPAEALPRYATTRRRHLAYYQRATRWLTPLFQSDSRVLGALRDLGFPVARRIGPFRRLMVRSMAGVAEGFFGQQAPLVGPLPSEDAPSSLRSADRAAS